VLVLSNLFINICLGIPAIPAKKLVRQSGYAWLRVRCGPQPEGGCGLLPRKCSGSHHFYP